MTTACRAPGDLVERFWMEDPGSFRVRAIPMKDVATPIVTHWLFANDQGSRTHRDRSPMGGASGQGRKVFRDKSPVYRGFWNRLNRYLLQT